jgi:glycosyltransferase involved in cell wall biosynthesis
VIIEIVASSRELFGSDRSAIRLASLLAGLGHDIRLAVPQSRPARGLESLAETHGLAVEAAPVVVVSSRGIDGLSGLRRRRPVEADLEIYNSAAVALRAGDRRPRALVLREWLLPQSLRHRALCALHARRMRAVIAISREVARSWRSCAGDALPVEVHPNWIDEAWLTDRGGRKHGGVLFAGRLNSWKGQLTLADAFDRAFAGADARPSLTFLGAEGPGSPFHANAVALGRRCSDRGWTLLPFDPEPIDVFRAAALVVVPSLRPEPFGNVILEALAAGARVIAFPGGGVSDIGPAFPRSIKVVDRNVDALARALRRWWSAGAPAQGEEERSAVLATLRARYTAQAVTPGWGRLIDRLAAG